jgi:hypothetical protein
MTVLRAVLTGPSATPAGFRASPVAETIQPSGPPQPAARSAGRARQGRSLSGSRAWKARPGRPFTPDATPMAQLRPSCDRPLLTVRNRQARRCYGHAEGTAGEDDPGSGVAATVTSSTGG